MNLTIAIPVEQEQRILDALKTTLMTEPEGGVKKAHFKVWVIQQIKEMVRQSERQAASKAAADAHVAPDLT